MRRIFFKNVYALCRIKELDL
nr:hypothetical protein [Treponema phagedenis]